MKLRMPWKLRFPKFHLAALIIILMLNCSNPFAPVEEPEEIMNTSGMWRRSLHLCTVIHNDTLGVPINYTGLKFQYQELAGGYFHPLGEKAIPEDPKCQYIPISVPNRPIRLWVAAIDQFDQVGKWRSIRSTPPDIEDIEQP